MHRTFLSKRNTHRIFLGNLFQKKILGTIYLHATSLLFFLFFFITVERDMERFLTSACATSYIHVQCSEDIYTSYNTIVRIYPAFFFARTGHLLQRLYIISIRSFCHGRCNRTTDHDDSSQKKRKKLTV